MLATAIIGSTVGVKKASAQERAAGILPLTNSAISSASAMQRDDAARIDDIVVQRLPEHRVGEHGLVIVEADEDCAAPPARGRVEAVDERLRSPDNA